MSQNDDREIHQGVPGHSYVERARDIVRKGRTTGWPCLPISSGGMSKVLFLAPKLYYLIGSSSSAGKTAFLDTVFLLEAYEHILEQKAKGELETTAFWYYYSMERPVEYKLNKWAAWRMWRKHKILVDVPTLMSWGATRQENRLPDDKFQAYMEATAFLEQLEDYVWFHEGPTNPTGIYRQMKREAEKRGKVIKKPDRMGYVAERYQPHNEKEIVFVVGDHFEKLMTERRKEENLVLPSGSKALLDKMSEYLSGFRDKYGWSPIWVSQFNRGYANTDLLKFRDLQPEESMFKGSGNMYNDADTVLAVWHPTKLQSWDDLGYQVRKFFNRSGVNRYRSVYLLKNSYGPDNLGFGYTFLGECGNWTPLPSPKQIDYTQLTTNII